MPPRARKAAPAKAAAKAVESGRTRYSHASDAPFDPQVWAEAGVSDDGQPLYTFLGDVEPGDAKAASDEWVVSN